VAAQSGQALWPFKSQIPGSNPGRSTFSYSATADVSVPRGDLLPLLWTSWIADWV
jgi:hypothetical protein